MLSPQQELQSIIEYFICTAIKQIFAIKRSDVSLIRLFDKISKFILNKLNDKKIFNTALTNGIIHKTTEGGRLLPLFTRALDNNLAQNQLGKIYTMYNDLNLSDGIYQLSESFKRFAKETGVSYIKEAKLSLKEQ